LDDIPATIPYGMNNLNIDSLSFAQNFLYLIDPSAYATKSDMLSAIAATNYDMLIVDINFNDEMLSSSDIAQLKVKANGGRRKVLCYFSIGEAENYRYYWKSWWNAEQPSFIVSPDPDWVDNFYVKYWDPQWQEIMYGGDDSYLNKILDAGFDGAYLDLVNAYEVFEK
ncbi:MAG TPA: endo alpha-1,4 polygalactosaminidase, partial [Bacteroidia bacterium]|nr:endo alpha-1,4 polygalactosaminidase [Bacteroidia bacterium]